MTYTVPNLSGVDFNLNAYIVPNLSGVDFELADITVDKIKVNIAGTWEAGILKTFIGSSWEEKPVKVWKAGSWFGVV